VRPVAGMVRIYVGASQKANVRPADLVGAITNEARIEGRQIGTIEVADRFSLVELPEDLVDRVIAAPGYHGEGQAVDDSAGQGRRTRDARLELDPLAGVRPAP
jgi:hypothetical protein